MLGGSGRFVLPIVLGVQLLCFTASAESQMTPGLALKLAAEDLGQLVSDIERFGDPVRGAMTFYQPVLNCIKCHSVNEVGRRLGPDLSEKREVTIQHLVESLLNPSAQIKEKFESVVVQHVDGRLITGILVEKTDAQLVVDQIEQPEKPLTLSIDVVEDWKLSSKSTMPEGIVNQIQDRNSFLDLVSYLKTIATDGPERAAELKPSDSLFALAPLPEYESSVDHAGLIRGLDRAAFNRGKEIYRLRCASCHGTKTDEGSMPASMRFRTGPFKHGADPLTMYKTLTHGYGMMIPQRWMVPQQKYDVIHYIRKHFLEAHNPSQLFEITDNYLAGLPAGDSRGPKPVESKPWTQMDYGPSLFNTIEVSDDGSNIAQKGIAVRLDDGPGGVESGKYFLMYDHDTMRVAAVWTGGFIDYNGIHFNGVHGQHPKIAGKTILTNPVGPGWADPLTGSFEDNRLVGRDSNRYGPLERSWAHYKGMYRYGNQTILKYTVGNTEVLETPRLQFLNGQPVITRVLNIGPREKEMVVQLAQVPDAVHFESKSPNVSLLFPANSGRATELPSPGTRFNGANFAQIDAGDRFDMDGADYTISTRIKTHSDGTIFCKTKDQTEWVPGGKSFFIRGGSLVFDIGWVGSVQSNKRINDGEWHDVAVSWEAATSTFRFYIDGEPAGDGQLEAERKLRNGVVRIGFTNEDFPGESNFEGNMDNLRFFQSCLNAKQLKKVGDLEFKPIVHLDSLVGDQIKDLGPNQLHATFSDAPETSHTHGVAARFLPASVKASFRSENGNLRLVIPSGEESLNLQIQLSSATDPESVSLLVEEMKRSDGSSIDLGPLTRGGPANYSELLEAKTIRGDEAPLAVDVLKRPKNNPWQCRLRMTGIDFSEEGTEAVVSTWDGSVWRVSGLLSENGILQWQRIAAGLFQPLGIKWIDEKIFVSCRDQIVILHDLNGDREIDWYENFNNDHQVTPHFHEFAMGLQTDAEGNFYYAKSARHALTAVVPHHGTLLKVSKDGSKTSIVANGFRAANGVCINPDGTFVVTDQEGHWNPKNRINWVEQGGFYGNMFGYHDVVDESDEAMTPPLCWITNSFDRSPAELMWVDSEKWGPLNGSLLNFSYGFGKIFICPHEEVNEQKQGGMCEFPLDAFPTGVMRGRFNKADGQLYCCGMFAWSGTQQQPGGFYRIRYTGAPVHLPVKLSATKRGLTIGFSGSLDRDSVSNAKNFAIQTWDLKRTRNYGSDHYNEKRLEVTEAELLPDGKTVRLTIPDIKPTWGMEIRYTLKTQDGGRVQNKIHNTIHHLRK